jgi:hypothetical protein
MPLERTAHLSGIRIGLAGRPLDTSAEGESVEGEVNEDYVLSREQEAVSIDEAIVSLARAVFSESGTMVFEDHPLLTPLLEDIALEYWQVPQLEARRKESRELSNPRLLVVGHPRSEENWFTRIPALMNYTPEIPAEFDAIVFIANQVQDFQRWNNRRTPRKYVIPSTGGMAREVGSAQEFVNLDEELWGVIQGRRSEIRFESRSKENDTRGVPQEEVPEFRYAVYPLLMRRIVEDVIRGRRG